MPRSNCHAEGDEPARSHVQNHARDIDLSSSPSGTKNNLGLNRATQDRRSTGVPMLLGLIGVEAFGFIFLAASVDRTAREVCAAAPPTLQSKE
jgi:hypothetical protein